MSQTTNISWADHTASPWFGCTEVSPGCANCYARELTLQKKWAGWGDKAPRVRSKGFWSNAYKWNRSFICKSCGAAHAFASLPDDTIQCPTCETYSGWHRARLFTSLMDWLDPQVPIEWLADFLKVVHDCQNLDWLLLTKRPENFKTRLELSQQWFDDLGYAEYRKYPGMIDWVGQWYICGNAPPNVWFGVTVENQEMADKRLPILNTIPAKLRWISAEPLLGGLNLQCERSGHSYNWLKRFEGTTNDGRVIDWVVGGGESGRKRRDCGVEAIVDMAEQCKAAGVPVFVKQDCALKPGQQGRIPDHIWKRKEFPST